MELMKIEDNNKGQLDAIERQNFLFMITLTLDGDQMK
jgi:hypothetical protein